MKTNQPNTTPIKDVEALMRIAEQAEGIKGYGVTPAFVEAIQTYIDNKILEARIATLENVQDTYRNSESLFPLLLRSLIKELKSNQSKG